MSLRSATFQSLAAFLTAAVLSGCAQEFPLLCDVPDRPEITPAAERALILERLEADREAQRDALSALSE